MAVADEVEGAAGSHPADHLAHLRELAPGAAHARLLAPSRDTFAERPEQRRVDVLDGEVVDQRDGPGADAETSLTFIATQSMPTVS